MSPALATQSEPEFSSVTCWTLGNSSPSRSTGVDAICRLLPKQFSSWVAGETMSMPAEVGSTP